MGDAFAIHEIPNVTDQLMKVIQYALQLAEESTSIPLITQGMSGETQPETLGATNIQNNNANQVLRSIGYAFDDHITEPVVRQYYEWLLLDPEVPDEEKGEFTINAHGSIALVERAIQDQTIAQMGTTVLTPAFGINPKKWAKMFLKSKRLDPEDLQYTEEEQKKIDEAGPPKDPKVQVAEISAKTAADELAVKKANDEQATMVSHIEVLNEIHTRRELALLDYANRRQMSLEAVKAELAKTAMTLDAQRELNSVDHLVDLHKNGKEQAAAHTPQVAQPAAEVPGRAPNGRGFEQ